MRNRMGTALLITTVGLSSPPGVDAAEGASGKVLFSEPVAVIAGPPSAIRLTIGPDGNHQLYGEVRSKDRGGLQIRERRQTETGWGSPEDVSFNTGWNDFDPAYAPDGSGVYFFSNRPGGEGGDDIWFVPLAADAWGEPVNLGAPVNTSGNEWAPTPLSDGRLLFSSDGHDGVGGQDLYVSARGSDGWGAPENLGKPVNSPADDYDAAWLSEDALMLTRSDDPGSGSELFYSCRTEQGFTEPRPAGPNVNLGGGGRSGLLFRLSIRVFCSSARVKRTGSARVFTGRVTVFCVARGRPECKIASLD